MKNRRNLNRLNSDRLPARRFPQRGLIGGLLAILVALGGLSSASAQGFTYPEDTRPSSLVPFFAEDMSSVRMLELIFDSLVFINKRGDVEGGLATSWKVSADRQSISFVLREGVTWHDGKPFTAEDVVFTIKAAQDPKTIFNAKSKFSFIQDVTAQGKFGVNVSFNRPVNEAERRFRFKILPSHAFKGKTRIKRSHRFSRKPIGTGPFKIKRYAAREVVLDINDAYWNPAKITSMRMQHTPDKRAQVDLLKFSGKQSGVQAVIFLPPKNVPLFENSDTVVLESYHTVSWWYLAFNHKNKALKNQKVREAMALAIDREELRSAHLGQGDILSGPFIESSPFYNFEVDPREQDLERARQLLDDAGFKARKKGQTRKKGRTKLRFTMVIDKDLASGQELALGLQAQLKKIGVELKTQFVDHAKYREQVFKKRKFDLTMNVWSFEEVEDIYPLFHSKGVINFINFKNPEIDKLLETAKSTNDYKRYKEYQKQLHAKLNQDLPYFFLWSLDVYSGISKQVKNVFIQPYYYFTSFHEWGMRR